MEVIWKLVETCIIPIITYGGETWDLNKGETQTANRILDSILKRLLLVPTSTPREVLYHETGIMDIQHIIMKNRINMHHRLEVTKNELINEMLKMTTDKAWIKKTEEAERDMNMEYITYMSKKDAKKQVQENIYNKFKETLHEQGANKSKVQFLIEGATGINREGRPTYMQKFTRYEASTIFKARTRMIDVKNNYRGKYQDLMCRICKEENETQIHVFEECKALHKDTNTKVTREMIFSNDVNILEQTVKKIDRIMTELKCVVHENVHPGYPGNHTTN